MDYEAAPLEGITDAVYRRNHAAFFPGVDRYYTPFISPTQHHVFTARQLRELAPENNPGLTLVPQLLGRNADDLLWAIRALFDMGYSEVDLNFGCPSGTVTAKRKGAGLLAYPDEMDALLDWLFRYSPASISIKTRLGMETPEEFERILSVYERYPLARLILHPRTRSEQYEGTVHIDAFRRTYEKTSLPLCYNGDLKKKEDIRTVETEFPSLCGVMVGRGLISDPSLFSVLRGKTTSPGTLRAFHDALCEEYPRVFGDYNSALHRMKAIWSYMLPSLTTDASFKKRLVKTRRFEVFRSICDEIFAFSE